MSPSDIGFPVYVTCINMLDALKGFGLSQYEHVNTRRIQPCWCAIAHQHKTLPDFCCENRVPPFPYSHVESLVRIAFCVLWYIWGEVLPNFCRGNLATIPNTLGKHRSRPHPFRNQTSKPNMFKAPKANANSLFSIANVLKLWFYQNKGLSTNRHCGVPNTFPTHN